MEECISNSDAPTINLSGGGDPFYCWKENYDFFEHIYKLACKYNKQMDIHTRILPSDLNLLSKFRKIALSIEKDDVLAIQYLKEMYPSIKHLVKIRVINVLNEKTTVSDCLEYIKIMKSIGIEQITFRQMFGNKKAYENFNTIKDKIHEDGVLFLKDGEYHNYYFTTNNKLYPYFFGHTEEDRKMWMKKYEDIEQSCG